jgi:hypothetical protein
MGMLNYNVYEEYMPPKSDINIESKEIFDIKTEFEEIELKNPELAYTKENVELYLSEYKIGYILNKYPKRLKDKVIDRIITNLKLRNPEHRKHKVKLEDVIREIFADGLTEMDIKNKKIEAAIKLSKGEIAEEDAEEIFNMG